MIKLLGFGAFICVAAVGIGQAFVRQPGAEAPASLARGAAPKQQAALASPKPAQGGPQTVSLAADASGHFVADIKINGLFLKGLVDTGATSVAIPLEEAKKVGINPRPSEFTTRIQTANGETRGAVVRLSEVRLDSIVVRDVEAVVVDKGLAVTLVGMSFIRKLQSSEMRGNMLILRQ